jgi:hypothetical protein
MSWQQLLDFRRQAEEEARAEEERRARPQACPNDGTPLEQGPDGELFCRHDGWKATG